MIPSPHPSLPAVAVRARVDAVLARAETLLALEDAGVVRSDLQIAADFEASTRAVVAPARVASVPPGTPRMGAVVFISACFFLCFTAYGSAQSVLVVLLPATGVVNLAVIYYVFSVSALVAPLLIFRLSAKWTMAVAMAGYVSWFGGIWSGIEAVAITFAVVIGIAAGPLWTACGAYLARANCGATGFNVFGLCMALSTVTGAVLGGIVLSLVDVPVYLAVMLSVCATGLVATCLAPSLQPRPGETPQVVTWRSFARPFLLAVKPKMLLMVCTIAARACVSVVLIAVVPKLVVQANLTSFVNIAYAVCLVITQVVMLFAWSWLDVRVWSSIFSGFAVVAMVLCGVSLTTAPGSEPRLLLLFFCAGLCGVAQAVSNGLTTSFLSTLFVDDPTSSFSVLRCLEAIFTASFFIMASLTSPDVTIVVCACLCTVSFVCVWVLCVLLRRERDMQAVVVRNPTFGALPT